MTKKQIAAQEAIAYLRTIVTPGTTVYTSCPHVARSGMSRHICCYVVKDGGMLRITGYVGIAMDYRRNDRTGGVVVTGCGMDMGFHVVNNLSYTLHGTKDVGHKPTPRSANKRSYRAGYSLTHRWL